MDLAALGKLLDIRKLPIWVWLAGTLVAGFLVLAPSSALDATGLAEIREKVRPWLGLGLLVGTAGLTARGIAEGWKVIAKHLEKRRRLQQLLLALKQLSPGEKELLRRYIDKETKTQYLHVSDGLAAGLEHAGIIYRSTSLAAMGTSFAFNIQPWAWTYLKDHPEHLAGAAPDPVKRPGYEFDDDE